MIAAVFLSDRFARNRSLAAAILCAALSGCGFTLLMPVVGLNLEAMTGSAALVGLNGAAAAISTILATPFIPRLMQRFPGRPLIAASLLFAALTLPLFPLFPSVSLWFGLRFLMGAAITIVFVASETWINQLASPERRATILGIYATALAGGFGMGGILVALLGVTGWAPWIAGAALFSLGAIPILLLRGPDIEPPQAADAHVGAMWRASLTAPAAIGAGLLFGATELSFFSLMPVYAERVGLTVAAIGLMMTAGAVGGIALQIPIGRLADRIGRLRVLVMIAAVCMIGPGFVHLAGASAPVLFAVMFLYVGIATALYTVGLARIGERFSGGAIAPANAAFIMAYGIGSLAGPPLGGVAMDAMNPWGVLVTMSALAAAYLLFLWARSLRRRAG